MMPNWFSIAAVVAIFFIGVLLIIELYALAALLMAMRNLVLQISERVDPLIDKTNTLLSMVNELTQTVASKAEHIAERTAETSDTLSAQVEKTSGLVQGMVAAPIIGGAAMAEGVQRGWEVWRERRRARHK